MVDKVLVVQANKPGAQPTQMNVRLARHLVAKGRFDYVNAEEAANMQTQMRRQVITRTGRPVRRVVKAATGNPNTRSEEDQPKPDEQNPDRRTEEMDQQEIERQEQITRDQEAENQRVREQSEQRDAEVAQREGREPVPGQYLGTADLEAMTVEDLKAEAAKRELDVTRGDGGEGAPLKADYVNAINRDTKKQRRAGK